jgi:hypothetical protein
MLIENRALLVSPDGEPPKRNSPWQPEKKSLAQILDYRTSRGQIVEKREILPDGTERVTLRGFLP